MIRDGILKGHSCARKRGMTDGSFAEDLLSE
jgi:hypothetical protein